MTFPTWWGKAAGEILEAVSWELAPTGEEELAELAKLVKACKTGDRDARVSKSAEEKLGQHRNEGYQRARKAVLGAKQKEAAKPEPHGAMLTQTYRGTQDAKQQIYAVFSAPHYDSFRRTLKTPPPLTDNMKPQPRVPGAMAVQSPMAEASAIAQPFGLEGAADFIVQYFQYRYVTAQDYLDTFTLAAQRDVDLMLASMVDYDWWLAQGNPPRTTLDTQVGLMTQISILSDGRVHGFAPFWPLREVAASAGLKNQRGDLANSSLAFVQNAIRNRGCVGVKLYPPMGFAPYGNAALDDPAKGGQSNFWKGGLLPEWTSALITYPDGTTKPLGQRMDDALDGLYKWCVEEEVPILAHTEESNASNPKYKVLAGAKYWAFALSKYPNLRVDFGHLGGLNEFARPTALPVTSQDFVEMLGSTASPNVYGDAAFSSSMVLNQAEYVELIKIVYQDGVAGKNRLPSRFLYGTDWNLLEQIGNNEVYMQRFAELFAG